MIKKFNKFNFCFENYRGPNEHLLKWETKNALLCLNLSDCKHETKNQGLEAKLEVKAEENWEAVARAKLKLKAQQQNIEKRKP